MFFDRTECIDLKSMPGRFPTELAADLVTKFGDLLVGELHQSAGTHADHVISWLEAVDEPVVSLFGVEESLRDDACFDQQADRSIDRRLGHSVVRASHVEQQLFDFEDIVTVDDRVEDLSSFRRVFQAFRLEISSKHRADRCHQLRKVLMKRF